jgi:hypothetical protein
VEVDANIFRCGCIGRPWLSANRCDKALGQHDYKISPRPKCTVCLVSEGIWSRGLAL